MHKRKTGDLIAASIMAGAIVADANDDIKASLNTFGYTLGLAFQVKDDILDEVGDPDVMGKQQGADLDKQKSTFTTVHGLEAAKSYLEQLRQNAINSLEPLGDNAKPLVDLTEFIVNRDH